MNLWGRRHKRRDFALQPPPPERLLKEESHVLVWAETLEGGERAIVKVYCHRKPKEYFREWLGRFRAEREFRTLERLTEAGVPCSEPLFWSSGRSDEHGYYEILATREIAEAENVGESIRAGRRSAGDFDLRVLLEEIHRMHECGIYHGTLHLYNILATGVGPELRYHIIDVPRSIVYPRSILGSRMAWFDLLRFARHVRSVMKIAAKEIPWAAYGLDAAQQERLVGDSRRYRHTKSQRRRLRVELLVRWWLATVGLRGPHPKKSLPSHS
ncbi:MAG: lipopolysaccharide kinase InaA family protein [Planctomycetota bacterium]